MTTLRYDAKALILSLAILAAHLLQGAAAAESAQDQILATSATWCDTTAVSQTL